MHVSERQQPRVSQHKLQGTSRAQQKARQQPHNLHIWCIIWGVRTQQRRNTNSACVDVITGGSQLQLVAGAQWQLWHPHSHSIRYSGCASYVTSVWVAIGVASCGTRPCQARGCVPGGQHIPRCERHNARSMLGEQGSKGEHRLFGFVGMLAFCW
jgi:hypothetical protein